MVLSNMKIVTILKDNSIFNKMILVGNRECLYKKV
jgi:hypothetical protein